MHRTTTAVAGLLVLFVGAGCASAGPSGWGSLSDPPEQAEAGTRSGDQPMSGDAGSSTPPEAGDVPQPEAGSTGGDASPAPTPPPPLGCTYPAGPYGFEQGQTVSPSFTWQGYAPGASTVSTLHAPDLLDCDGTKGINAIVLDESAIYCATCQAEAQDLEAQMTGSWLAEGVVFVTFISPDASGSPADTAAALQWKTTYGLNDVGVYADPNSLVYSPTVTAFPGSYLVDPRTMKIVQVSQGYSGPDPAVDQLAQKNK